MLKLFVDSWDFLQKVNNLIIKLLYYNSGAIAHSFSRFGQGIGEIHIDDVQCTGTESSLLACSYVSIDNCFHFEDAGVECNVPSCKCKYIMCISDNTYL